MRVGFGASPHLGRWSSLASAVLGVVVVLGGCAGELPKRGEPLRLLPASGLSSVLLERLDITLNAVGGLRPYTFTLTSGALPAGVTLANGTFTGTPTETGTFDVTVEVSDANLSRVSQTFALQITKAPAPRLIVEAPLTEVRGPVTVRVRLEDARAVTGVRTLLTWNPEQFSAASEGAARSRRDVALFWQADDSSLQVDLAPLGKELSGRVELFEFVLTPVAPPQRLALTYSSEVLATSADPDRAHDFISGSVGRESPAAPGSTEPEVPGEPPPPEQEGGPDSPPSPGAGQPNGAPLEPPAAENP